MLRYLLYEGQAECSDTRHVVSNAAGKEASALCWGPGGRERQRREETWTDQSELTTALQHREVISRRTEDEQGRGIPGGVSGCKHGGKGGSRCNAGLFFALARLASRVSTIMKFSGLAELDDSRHVTSDAVLGIAILQQSPEDQEQLAATLAAGRESKREW